MTDFKEYALQLQRRAGEAGVTVKQVFICAGKHPDVIYHWLKGGTGREETRDRLEAVILEYEAIKAKYPAYFETQKQEIAS